MTNYEWLVKNDAELVRSILTRHLSNVKGRPSSCLRTQCTDCDFGSGNCRSFCIINAKAWLEDEHEPLYKKGDIVITSYGQLVVVKEDDPGESTIAVSNYVHDECISTIPITDIKKKVGHIESEEN